MKKAHPCHNYFGQNNKDIYLMLKSNIDILLQMKRRLALFGKH
jgi:hypothetical protein